MEEMNYIDLDKVTGGEIEGPESFDDATVICGGNLYNISNLREIAGQIHTGQKVRVHPTFRYKIDGVELCAVEVGGMTYFTEWTNIALGG